MKPELFCTIMLVSVSNMADFRFHGGVDTVHGFLSLWSRVVWWLDTTVSKYSAAVIFRDEVRENLKSHISNVCEKTKMQWTHPFDHALHSCGLRNVGFQPSHYTTQHPREQRIPLLFRVRGFRVRFSAHTWVLWFSLISICKYWGEVRGVYRVLVGRPEGKRPLGRPRRRWEDNVKLDLREIGIDGANWTQLAQDRVQRRAFVNTIMNLRVP
jgi:hypothetical protein